MRDEDLRHLLSLELRKGYPAKTSKFSNLWTKQMHYSQRRQQSPVALLHSMLHLHISNRNVIPHWGSFGQRTLGSFKPEGY